MWSPFRKHHERLAEEAGRVREAQQELAELRAETPKVRALAAALRELREQNHFAAAITHTFRGDR